MNAVAQPFGATRRASALARVRWAPALALTFAFGLREVLVWDHASPDYLPDEYQYAAIARSLASSLRPDVRGQSAHLAALLAPILTAPAWIAGSVATDFRVAQAIGALAMTLTAVPVYLLARRVGLTPTLAYAAAAFTLVIPDNILAGDLLSEPFAYPLVLAACLAGSVALAAEPAQSARVCRVRGVGDPGSDRAGGRAGRLRGRGGGVRHLRSVARGCAPGPAPAARSDASWGLESRPSRCSRAAWVYAGAVTSASTPGPSRPRLVRTR